MHSEPICISCGKPFTVVKTLMAASIVDNNKTYPIDFCSCGLGVTRVEEDLAQVIDESNSALLENLVPRVNIYFNLLRKHLTKRFKETLDIIGRYQPPGKKMLEVGANIGFTANIAKEYGYNVEACELNDKCRQFCSLVFNLVTSKDLFELNSTYDIVTLLDVLEHFPAPDAALSKIHDLLHDDGIVFIQLPNCESAMAKFQGAGWEFFSPPDHLFHFTLNTLKSTSERCGFSVVWYRTVTTLEFSFLRNLIPQYFYNHLFAYIHLLFPTGFIESKTNSGILIQMILKKNTIGRTTDGL